MSTRDVRTPTQPAIARFCVTARTNRPRRVRLSTAHTRATTASAKAMIAMRFHGSSRLGSTWMPPESHEGFATSTFCAPKIVRVAWMMSRLTP